MNRAELERLRKTLPFRGEIAYELWSSEQKKLEKELNCIDMINSCLIYKKDFMNSTYKDEYIAEFGLERVQELYDEQVEYIKNCTIIENAHTDSEGCSYNSLIEN